MEKHNRSEGKVISNPSLLAFYRVLNVVMERTREFQQPIRLCVWEKKETRNNLTNLWRHFRSYSASTPKHRGEKKDSRQYNQQHYSREREKQFRSPCNLLWHCHGISLSLFFSPSSSWKYSCGWITCRDISIVNSSSSFRLSCENAKIEKGRQRRPFRTASPPPTYTDPPN